MDTVESKGPDAEYCADTMVPPPNYDHQAVVARMTEHSRWLSHQNASVRERFQSLSRREQASGSIRPRATSGSPPGSNPRPDPLGDAKFCGRFRSATCWSGRDPSRLTLQFARTQALSSTPKQRIERHYFEEARRASPLIPGGEFVHADAPDFGFPRPSGTLAIELTELCREGPRREAGRLAKVTPRAKNATAGFPARCR